MIPKTIEEFNEKYKDYLEEGHYGLDIDIEELIVKLDEKFQEYIKTPGFKYSQIKEKFGTARAYTTLDAHQSSRLETMINFFLL